MSWERFINKVTCGDCLELMKEIPDGAVDMILADPPYGTTACKWDTIIPLEPMWKQLKRVIKPNGAIVMTASQPFTTILIASNIKMFKYEWIWKKSRSTGFQNSKFAPMRNHEDIVVFYENPPVFNQHTLVKLAKPIKSWRRNGKGGNLLNGVNTYGKDKLQQFTNYHKTVLEIKNEHNVGKHPTQKPVALMEYLIKTYTNEGEIVLDFTIGSGTTAVACIRTFRKFIGFEIEPKYVDITEERLKQEVLGL